MAGLTAQSTGVINGVIQPEGRLLAEEAGTVHFKRNAIAEEAGLTFDQTESSSIKRRAGVLAEKAGRVHFKRNAISEKEGLTVDQTESSSIKRRRSIGERGAP